MQRFLRNALSVTLLVIVATLARTGVARAEIIETPIQIGGNNVGFVAPHEYTEDGHNAAVCEMLGFDWYSLPQTVKEQITSGPNAFVTYASTVKNLQYDSPVSVITDGIAHLTDWITNYGMSRVWYFVIDAQARQDASDFVATVVAENGNGGGGGGTSGGPVVNGRTVTFVLHNMGTTMHSGSSGYFNVLGSSYSLIQAPNQNGTYLDTLTLSVTFKEDIKDDYDYICYAKNNTSSGTTLNYGIVALKKGSYTVDVSEYDNGTVSLQVMTFTTTEGWYGTSGNTTTVVNGFTSQVSAAVNYPRSLNTPNSPGVVKLPIDVDKYNANIGWACSYVDAGTVDPPVYPVGPTAPTLPEPNDNGTTVPSPTYPGPDVSVNIDLPDVTFSSPVTGTDVIPYLQRIIANQEQMAESLETWLEDSVNQLTADLATHCNHIVSALETGFGYVADTITNEIGQLQQYLRALTSYMDQSVNQNIDDSDRQVTNELRKIYSRLGGTGITKPDPTTDEPGFLDWLLDMIHNLLIDLISVLPDELGGLVDVLSQLTHYFPFSIPWDIAAMLALFIHTPVIPVFDFPIPVPDFISPSNYLEIHIDLTPWDGAAQMVRPLFLVLFCLGLALRTPDMIKGIMNLDEGGA